MFNKPTPEQIENLHDALLYTHDMLHAVDENLAREFCDTYLLSEDDHAKSAQILLDKLAASFN